MGAEKGPVAKQVNIFFLQLIPEIPIHDDLVSIEHIGRRFFSNSRFGMHKIFQAEWFRLTLDLEPFCSGSDSTMRNCWVASPG